MPTQSEILMAEQAQRLELIRETEGLTQSKFAELLEIKPASYSDIKQGRNGISTNVQWHLEKKLNINLRWLLNGVGNMNFTGMETEEAKVDNPLADKSTDNLYPVTWIEKLYKMMERREKNMEAIISDYNIENKKLLEEIHCSDESNTMLLSKLIEKMEASNKINLDLYNLLIAKLA